jgi:hypothetical protein
MTAGGVLAVILATAGGATASAFHTAFGWSVALTALALIPALLIPATQRTKPGRAAPQMTTSRELRSDVPEVLGGAIREVLFVDADLPGDDLEALLEVGELLLDAGLLLSQQVQALLLVARPLAHEPGVAADLCQWHPGRPQLDAEHQPLHVHWRVTAMAARSARDVLGEHQARTLVEPQRVHAQSRSLRNVADAQPCSLLCFETRHASHDSPLI